MCPCPTGIYQELYMCQCRYMSETEKTRQPPIFWLLLCHYELHKLSWFQCNYFLIDEIWLNPSVCLRKVVKSCMLMQHSLEVFQTQLKDVALNFLERLSKTLKFGNFCVKNKGTGQASNKRSLLEKCAMYMSVYQYLYSFIARSMQSTLTTVRGKNRFLLQQM